MGQRYGEPLETESHIQEKQEVGDMKGKSTIFSPKRNAHGNFCDR